MPTYFVENNKEDDDDVPLMFITKKCGKEDQKEFVKGEIVSSIDNRKIETKKF